MWIDVFGAFFFIEVLLLISYLWILRIVQVFVYSAVLFLYSVRCIVVSWRVDEEDAFFVFFIFGIFIVRLFRELYWVILGFGCISVVVLVLWGLFCFLRSFCGSRYFRIVVFRVLVYRVRFCGINQLVQSVCIVVIVIEIEVFYEEDRREDIQRERCLFLFLVRLICRCLIFRSCVEGQFIFGDQVRLARKVSVTWRLDVM